MAGICDHLLKLFLMSYIYSDQDTDEWHQKACGLAETEGNMWKVFCSDNKSGSWKWVVCGVLKLPYFG